MNYLQQARIAALRTGEPILEHPFWQSQWATQPSSERQKIIEAWLTAWDNDLNDWSHEETQRRIRSHCASNRHWLSTTREYLTPELFDKFNLGKHLAFLPMLLVPDYPTPEGLLSLDVIKTLWFGNDQERLSMLLQAELSERHVRHYGPIIQALAWDIVGVPGSTLDHYSEAACISIAAGRRLLGTPDYANAPENDVMWHELGRTADSNPTAEQKLTKIGPLVTRIRKLPVRQVFDPCIKLVTLGLTDRNNSPVKIHRKSTAGSVLPKDATVYDALIKWLPALKNKWLVGASLGVSLGVDHSAFISTVRSEIFPEKEGKHDHSDKPSIDNITNINLCN